MQYRKFILTVLALFSGICAMAQTGGVRGVVLNRVDRHPVKDAQVILYVTPTGTSVYTGEDGTFEIRAVEDGMYRMEIKAANYMTTTLNVKIEGGIYDLRDISIAPSALMNDFGNEFSEFDNENESGAGYEDVPSVLSSSQDVFESIASYSFGAMRFRSRGYESGLSDVYINGIRFNDAMNGYTPYSLFSGLNEATREKESVGGMTISDYGTGGIGGLTNINAYASTVAKGYRFSVLTNSSTYRARLMATYSTGKMDNGWAFALSLSGRLGGNDYVDGVFYRGLAYFASAEKFIGDKHRFSLTVFGSPVQRGAQNASTQEVYDMLGNNWYNSNWGYQNGKMRNARVRNNHEPVALFNYEFTPNYDMKLSVGLSYRFGKNGYSALDWYDAQDPRPDYYRNLPSYFKDDPDKAEWALEGWLTNDNIRHVNWDRMYDVNRNSYFEEGEYSKPIDFAKANRSKYILEERHADQNDINANAHFMMNIGPLVKATFGYNFRWNQTEYYKIVKDLLGGDYWLDVDQFAERDFGSGDQIFNDIRYPNRLVRQGEKYGYDYYAQLRNHRLWTTWTFNAGGFEASLAGEGGYTSFWREGLMQKGLFPDNSLGRSAQSDFFTYRAKLGLAYKFSGQNVIYANVGYMTEAPYFDEAFLSPRTRNSLVKGLTTEKIFSADLNYSLKIGDYALRVSAFYTDIKDRTDLISFYDDLQRAYTNFSMTGIDQRHLGVELGVKIPIYAGLAFEGAVSYGNYVYTSNPYVTQTVDNSERVVLDNAQVYWQGYKVPSTPQLATSIGLTWRGKNYLFAGIDLNYFDGMYISMNPLRRTDYALTGMDLNTEEGIAAMQQMTRQEKFKGAWVLNANIGKSWRIKYKYLIGVSANVNNILHNKNIKTGGYEQMRLSRNEVNGVTVYSPFDSKYFYMFGINYMINVYFRF